eukprot:7118994-Pyramimonas_sp.AAC.1
MRPPRSIGVPDPTAGAPETCAQPRRQQWRARRRNPSRGRPREQEGSQGRGGQGSQRRASL